MQLCTHIVLCAVCKHVRILVYVRTGQMVVHMSVFVCSEASSSFEILFLSN